MRRDSSVNSALDAMQKAVAADLDSPLTTRAMRRRGGKYFVTKDKKISLPWLKTRYERRSAGTKT